MGGCCSNTHSQMDYLDELRQDAKISEYETKDNDDIFKSIVSPRLDEKIVFQIKDDEYEQCAATQLVCANGIYNAVEHDGLCRQTGTPESAHGNQQNAENSRSRDGLWSDSVP